MPAKIKDGRFAVYADLEGLEGDFVSKQFKTKRAADNFISDWFGWGGVVKDLKTGRAEIHTSSGVNKEVGQHLMDLRERFGV